MTIYDKVLVNGSEILDKFDLNIRKTTGEVNISSYFSINLDNVVGKNTVSPYYKIGDEVVVYADQNINPPTTKIFTGLIEDVNFTGLPHKEKLTIAGRDYTAYLQDRTVEPEVYNNLPAGSIVKDIITKYAEGLTINNVNDSTVTIKRISFNHTPVYDSIKQLADASNYIFYVDNDKDLHFEEPSTVDSGFLFDNTNVLNDTFKQQRDSIYNEIWVYGDRYLDGFKETFVGDGAGSVFTLLYKPHNTSITVDTTLKQPGGIFGMLATAGSDVKYLVAYEDKQIVFTSGTDTGDNIPGAGSNIFITYDRLLPIVKVGTDETSKFVYGKRTKIITDKNIKDPETAAKRVSTELGLYSLPEIEGQIEIQGILNVIPSQTCRVNLPNSAINNQEYDILETDYNFNVENNLNETVLSIKLNKNLNQMTDNLKDMILDLKKIEGGDIDSSDVITRLQFTTGSVTLRQNGCVVSMNGVGSSFILGNINNGILGSPSSLLGDNRTSYVIQWSGCYQEGYVAPGGGGGTRSIFS